MSDEIRPVGSDMSSVMQLLSERQLLVVTNREPYSHHYEGDKIVVSRPVGGLTSALDSVIRMLNATWIAWGSGDADKTAVNGHDHVQVPPKSPAYDLRRVWIDEDVLHGYYYGFSNQVLWPLCHGFPSKINYDIDFWQHYRRVNKKFADAVAAEVNQDAPIVWIHDYHFTLAPSLIRRKLPEKSLLAHFWHVPWPPWEIFQRCPHGRDIVIGLLDNDLIGVHTAIDRDHLVRCAQELLDATYDPATGALRHDGNRTCLRVAPLTVDAQAFAMEAQSQSSDSFYRQFADKHNLTDSQIAVGVDRLDYTKGIEERLEALERLWEKYPEYQSELTYVQKASKSRGEIDAYQAVQQDVKERIESINRQFGTEDWQPIVYYEKRLSRKDLTSLYRNADIAIVTPNRDGLNLVAKEYVATQINRQGVLIISKTAGVAKEFADMALTVTPLNTESVAETIRQAIELPESDRRHRIQTLVNRVHDRETSDWVRNLFYPLLEQPTESLQKEDE